nr:GNAT family N-acetyltransferase [Candidatus Sigynarchaeota archaeon]
MAITKTAAIAAPAARDWASLRHARPGDVAAIQNIYQEVYRGTYTYQEYTDALYLNKDMTGGHSGWYVVEDATRGKEIAGCVSATIDGVHGRAYSRGMMVRPGWQGRGGASRLFGEAFQDFLKCNAGKVRLVWSETRSDGVKPQAVCETIGLQPIGILPSKDVFFNRRETPVLMAVYASSAWATRDNKVRIVPELVPLYEQVKSMHRPMRKDDLQVVETPAPSKARCKAIVDIEPFEKKYGYTAYTFICEKTGESISVAVNKQCMNAESMETHCTKAATAQVLLAFLLGYLQAKGVQYIEGHAPANRPTFQEAFLAVGMRPCAYLPAWEKDARSGLHVDHVVFAWHKQPVDLTTTSFTPKSEALARVLGVLPAKDPA